MDQYPAMPHLALPDVPTLGDVIAEKYRVEGILGVGGMGVVLDARHLQLGQSVAIKVLSIGKDRQQDAVDRFLREGRAAAALTCDHVVRIYDVGQLTTGIPYMVMERLRGKDLSTLLTEFGSMSVEDAVEYIAQATIAISEAHEVGIIHRDLKPSNLFLTLRSDGSPCIKVLDFGISKYLTETDAQTLRGDLTSTRQVMGSPAYMSPEQVRDAKTVDHRTDIWALGVTLYELLTHCPAFDADTLPAICAAIAADTPVPMRQRRPDVPEPVAAIVSRCLEKPPALRYGSAREMLVALRSWQGKPVERAPLRSDRPGVPFADAFDAAILRDRKSRAGASVASPSHEAMEPSGGTLVSGRPQTGFRLDTQDHALDPASLQRLSPNAARSGAAELDTSRLPPGAASLTTGRITAAVRGSGEVSDGPRRAVGTRTYTIGLSSAALFLVGATTLWFFNRAADPQRGVGSATPLMQPEQSSASLPARFTLHIESEPSVATVLEGDTVLGVTPLSVDLDRTLLRQAAKQLVIRKPGFADARIRQEDSMSDVRVNVSLAKAPDSTTALAPTAMPMPSIAPQVPRHPGKAVKSMHPVNPAASKDSSTAVAAPQIRTMR